MKTFLNYLGQFRLYSLVDLILLLIATQANTQVFLGVIFLHLGFLAFLETRHSHSYRNRLPKCVWIIFTIIGIFLYRHWEVVAFLLISYLYTKKNHGYFASISPLLRGFQYFFLIAGIVGYHHPLSWIALATIFIRNFAGDLRDTTKDRDANMKTLPVLLGLNKNIPNIHLIAVLLTSVIWWSFTSLSIWALLIVLIIEIGTYNITPR